MSGSVLNILSTRFISWSAVAIPQEPTERHTESLAQPTGRRFTAKLAKVPRDTGPTGAAAAPSSRASEADRPSSAPPAVASPGPCPAQAPAGFRHAVEGQRVWACLPHAKPKTLTRQTENFHPALLFTQPRHASDQWETIPVVDFMNVIQSITLVELTSGRTL